VRCQRKRSVTVKSTLKKVASGVLAVTLLSSGKEYGIVE
jgi:hypothetical protein